MSENKTIPAPANWVPDATLSKADVVFGGAGKIDKLLPAYSSLPKEFTDYPFSPWHDTVNDWFFKGMNAESLHAKEAIDKDAALKHLSACMGSYAPKHEHKIAGVAYLCSLWFAPVPTKEQERAPQ